VAFADDFGALYEPAVSRSRAGAAGEQSAVDHDATVGFTVIAAEGDFRIGHVSDPLLPGWIASVDKD
jgi:hypothetical protein